MNPFIIVRNFDTDASSLWRALTEKDLMKLWYFDIPDFKAEIGHNFSFLGTSEDGTQYKHLCEITELIPYEKLTYSWRYEGYEGISYVTFELEELDQHTKLTLTHAGLESFPLSNPDFAKENFAAGWSHIIGVSLTEYINHSKKR